MNWEKFNFSSNMNIPEEKKREKELFWREKMAEVNKITDNLGKGVDEKIKETVCAFLIYGFTTSASCEGHLEEEHGLPYPWVEIYAPEPKGWREAEGEKKEEIEREWKRQNLEQQKKMMNLLEEFYKERETPFDARLVFNYIGAFGGFRVQSFGAEIIPLLSPEEKKEKLALYQKEMKDFTEFLKKKYLSEK